MGGIALNCNRDFVIVLRSIDNIKRLNNQKAKLKSLGLKIKENSEKEFREALKISEEDYKIIHDFYLGSIYNEDRFGFVEAEELWKKLPTNMRKSWLFEAKNDNSNIEFSESERSFRGLHHVVTSALSRYFEEWLRKFWLTKYNRVFPRLTEAVFFQELLVHYEKIFTHNGKRITSDNIITTYYDEYEELGNKLMEQYNIDSLGQIKMFQCDFQDPLLLLIALYNCFSYKFNQFSVRKSNLMKELFDKDDYFELFIREKPYSSQKVASIQESWDFQLQNPFYTMWGSDAIQEMMKEKKVPKKKKVVKITDKITKVVKKVSEIPVLVKK